MYPQSTFLAKKKKNIEFFLMKFSIFTGEKNLYILHRQVLVMWVWRVYIYFGKRLLVLANLLTNNNCF